MMLMGSHLVEQAVIRLALFHRRQLVEPAEHEPENLGTSALARIIQCAILTLGRLTGAPSDEDFGDAARTQLPARRLVEQLGRRAVSQPCLFDSKTKSSRCEWGDGWGE